ncbi:MAG: hypothetical protein RL514_243 [Verrucomicrobiota bacterium]|jgi:prepilin-type N-terminal cleavage/methylation domain-containing protein
MRLAVTQLAPAPQVLEGVQCRLHALRATRAFTLIEMMVVLGIIGILAALTLPSFTKAGKGNVIVTASRQLMDDLAYARIKAMSQRTKVYVVFVPDLNFFGPLNPAATAFLTTNQAANDLAGGQLTAYALYSPRMVGEQPGQSTARYLGEWRSLPDGAFIPRSAFRNGGVFHNAAGGLAPPTAFSGVPLLLDDGSTNLIALPFIAFDESGRLFGRTTNIAVSIIEGSILHPKDATGTNNAVIDTDAVETSLPIASGQIVAGIEYLVAGNPGAQIRYPPGSTIYRAGHTFVGGANPNYTTGVGARVVPLYAVRIDCLTGRAKLVQPEIR